MYGYTYIDQAVRASRVQKRWRLSTCPDDVFPGEFSPKRYPSKATFFKAVLQYTQIELFTRRIAKFDAFVISTPCWKKGHTSWGSPLKIWVGT